MRFGSTAVCLSLLIVIATGSPVALAAVVNGTYVSASGRTVSMLCSNSADDFRAIRCSALALYVDNPQKRITLPDNADGWAVAYWYATGHPGQGEHDGRYVIYGVRFGSICRLDDATLTNVDFVNGEPIHHYVSCKQVTKPADPVKPASQNFANPAAGSPLALDNAIAIGGLRCTGRCASIDDCAAFSGGITFYMGTCLKTAVACVDSKGQPNYSIFSAMDGKYLACGTKPTPGVCTNGYFEFQGGCYNPNAKCTAPNNPSLIISCKDLPKYVGPPPPPVFACSVPNGVGTKVGLTGECKVTSCEAGYDNYGNSCQSYGQRTCPMVYGIGVQACSITGKCGVCNAVQCGVGFKLWRASDGHVYCEYAR